ncbi:hypothetical protein M2341_002513 [Sphingobium sp. B7D2B]|uniref:hypothetical protein n=1 Tax=Sphingobium sp. B7D2B TaxID=2940583 RepID=UPI0022243FD6|nr:hypothetical protein [Sphingobium sp. B7D2B]MCW2367066.1 hypothetical protein [Sphingobium sp. B7D2B]
MKLINRTINFMLAGVALPLLAGCGASEIASPGTGGIVINNPTPTPTPTPIPTPTNSVTAALGCPTINNPTQLTDSGTISGPTGTWRVCSLPGVISRNLTLEKIPGLVYYLNPAINNGRVDVGCDGGFSAPSSGSPRESTTVGCRASEIAGLGLQSSVANGSGQLIADTNVTLTIQPGVIVMGQGAAFLAVNRGNKLVAEGTQTSPIIFTSRDNVLGQETDTSIGHWGGVILMGRAPVTDCNFGTVGVDCERNTEGSVNPARFGGNDPTYNAGSMKYVQIRFSGFILSGNTELQALTTEGIGSGTKLDYIQSHNSSDDGAEFFGGVVKFKHYIATGADDDSLDLDTGAQGAFQHVMLIQRPGQGDALFEIDSDGKETDAPRSKLYVANFTALQSQSSTNNEANDLASSLFRGNSDTTLVNGVMVTPNNECIRLNGSGSTADRATLKAYSVLLQCNSAKFLGNKSSDSNAARYTAADVALAFGAGSNGNNDAYTSSLTSLFINGAAENAVAGTDPKTIAGLSTDFRDFFDSTTYVGAVKDANDTWYKGWTCNSSYAQFDDTSNTNRNCSSLPTT